MSRVPSFGLAGALAWAAATTASAQISDALGTYIQTPAHRAEVLAAMRPYVTSVPGCQKQTTGGTAVQVLAPPVFGPDGAPTAGAWIERLTVEGCGTSGLLNVMTMTRAGAAPLVAALLPGDTHASPLLQRDALPSARNVAFGKMKGGCGALYVIDTHFESFGQPAMADLPAGRDARTWRETWTLMGCGQRTTVAVQFVPDRTGTSFTASP